MTPSELKYEIEKTDPENCYFSRDSVRFFGDTMRNYGVRSTAGGLYWELYRKRPVKNGLKESVYWDKTTFKRSFPRGLK